MPFGYCLFILQQVQDERTYAAGLPDIAGRLKK